MADGPVTHNQLRTELVALEERLDGKIDVRLRELEDRLIERMRDMQSEIVHVFMEFQARNEDRDALQEKTAAVLSDRVASVERRLRQIEAKLLLEPPAA